MTQLETQPLGIMSDNINENWVAADFPRWETATRSVESFTISEMGATIWNIKCAEGHEILPGEYTRLVMDGDTMMSDTPKELLDHEMMFAATKLLGGHVLIAGLGLGCALNVIAMMDNVTKVTVIELDDDVMANHAPYFREKFGDKVEIIHASIFDWEPPKGVIYSVAWMDIWLHLSEDNLDEMDELTDKFICKCQWLGCWSEEEVRERLRMEEEEDEDFGESALDKIKALVKEANLC